MSELFENDIDNLANEDLSALEDTEIPEESDSAAETYEYPALLFKLKLEYSCEGVYATVPEQLSIAPGDYVIIPTRYGKDYARVMGQISSPVGIKPSDIIVIERKATDTDIKKAEDLKERRFKRKRSDSFQNIPGKSSTAPVGHETYRNTLSSGRAESVILFQCRKAG